MPKIVVCTIKVLLLTTDVNNIFDISR